MATRRSEGTSPDAHHDFTGRRVEVLTIRTGIRKLELKRVRDGGQEIRTEELVPSRAKVVDECTSPVESERVAGVGRINTMNKLTGLFFIGHLP